LLILLVLVLIAMSGLCIPLESGDNDLARLAQVCCEFPVRQLPSDATLQDDEFHASRRVSRQPKWNELRD
jgi:hypothetical protein